jgi:hypothetical protein
VRDHQRGSRRCRVCLWRDGRRLSGCMILMTTHLQKDFFLTGEENCTLCWIVGVEVLSHLRWGMLCVLLGVYHTLMWNRILQHGGRGLLHVLLWCLLRGRLCRRMGKTTRVFQPFEISDLGAMMSVMDELTTKGTREYGFNIISPLAFIIIISPLGVLVPLVLVAPSGLVLWGLIPALTWVVVILVSSFLLGIVRWMGWIGCIQLLKTLVLLNNRGLNKIHPRMRMWGSHGLWRTRKWEVRILWWY